MSGDRLIGRPPRPAADRFAEKHAVAPDGCWVWTGTMSTDGDGYGIFKVQGKLLRAHRWSYEHHVGPIPAGLTIDHLCRNRACVNPAHLEPVTNRENVMRGETLPAHGARRTHCLHGHLLDGFRNGHRYCKTCHRERAAAQRARAKEARLVG